MEDAPPTDAGKLGPMEQSVVEQMDSLRSQGYIENHHAAVVMLARIAARDLDTSQGKGAPSGRANLIRAMKEILETVPMPEAASKDALADVVAAMSQDDPADVLAPAYADLA
jgi:ribosomal protein S12 methylthiotransferase accessory factor YcaO